MTAETTDTTPRRVDARWDTLTPREWEVLRLICRGRTDVQIGKTLGISHRTVSTHAHSLYRKLGVESRTQAAIKAFRDRKVRR